MTRKQFYLIAAVIGTIIPWLFFGRFLAEEGLDIPGFISGLFENGAAGGFSADVLISIAVFWFWSYTDAQKHNVKNWWLMIITGCTVGLSLAMPLYFYLRETALEGQ